MNMMEETLRLAAAQKFWQTISKSTQLIRICSTVNEELQEVKVG